MASPCSCCGQVDPCNCIPVVCAGGTQPPNCLLASVVFPSGGACCCPYPNGGVETFPVRRANIATNLFPFPWQPSPCQTPCNNRVNNWTTGLPFGCPGYPNEVLSLCRDREVTSCGSSSPPVCPPPIIYGFDLILWVCRSGAPGFFLDFYGSPDYARLLCNGGSPCNVNCTDPGTLPQCKVLLARCQLPDPPFHRIQYDCNDLYLEYTVNSSCGPPGSGFNPGACGPVKVIIQTPP